MYPRSHCPTKKKTGVTFRHLKNILKAGFLGERVPEAILHVFDDLHHLGHDLLPHFCLESLDFLTLTVHLPLQDINGLQQSLDKDTLRS